MILADKIIALRKQHGWSQEELAGQLGVSRQAVSKWESTASIPDLERILKMSEIFQVSAPTEAETDEDLRSVSLEEADNFIEQKKRNCFSTALAIAAYILCPVVLIFLAGYSELATARISEDAAGGIGLVVLLLIVGAASAGKIRVFEKGEIPSSIRCGGNCQKASGGNEHILPDLPCNRNFSVHNIHPSYFSYLVLYGRQ